MNAKSTPAVVKSGQVYTPAVIAEANEKAAQVRRELHAAGHEEGLQKGLRLAERYRAVAYAFLGFVVGAALMGVFAMSITEHSAFTAGAVVDRVLQRTVTDGAQTVQPLSVSDAMDASSDCRIGRRDARGHCPNEPASAP